MDLPRLKTTVGINWTFFATGNCIGERNYGWYILLLMILTLLVILATAAAITLLIVDCYRTVLQYHSPHDNTWNHADDYQTKPVFSWLQLSLPHDVLVLLGDMLGALVYTFLSIFVFRLLCCHILNISTGQTTSERLRSSKNKHQREKHPFEHQSCGEHWSVVLAASFGCPPPPLSFQIPSSEGRIPNTMVDTEHQDT
jgi:DHHC palmitoyltransferase